MTLPDFSYEKKLFKEGFKSIAGVDEVGRGSFSGPVVAGCVVFPEDIIQADAGPAGNSSRPTSSDTDPAVTRRDAPRFRQPLHSLVKIDDSKRLTPKQREKADVWIRKNARVFGIGQASVSQINRFGIKKASEIAFRKAIVNCKLPINYLLIDAFYIPYVKGLRRRNQMAIVKGDTKVISIAAASIIAKVYRDNLMRNLGAKPKYRKYEWGRNKGYGTRQHREAIKKYGITLQHRKQFVGSWIKNSSSSRAR